MSGPSPRLAINDPYRPMSRQAIWQRLLAFEAPVGISRRRFLDFCKTCMPTSAAQMTLAQQEKFSKAFWQMDRGYLRATTTKRKNYLYLTTGGRRRQDDAPPPTQKAGWGIDFTQGSLVWRPPSCR
jgi:hypothetical protein